MRCSGHFIPVPWPARRLPILSPFGDSIPSGKLTVTFPRTVGQVPIYYNHMNTGRPADVLASTRDAHFSSKYIDVDFTPEYPFGFGLSYAHFQYSNLHLFRANLSDRRQTLQASADITNTSQFAADEFVQLYIRQLSASQTQPVRELKGFSRLHFAPGQTPKKISRLAPAALVLP